MAATANELLLLQLSLAFFFAAGFVLTSTGTAVALAVFVALVVADAVGLDGAAPSRAARTMMGFLRMRRFSLLNGLLSVLLAAADGVGVGVGVGVAVGAGFVAAGEALGAAAEPLGTEVLVDVGAGIVTALAPAAEETGVEGPGTAVAVGGAEEDRSAVVELPVGVAAGVVLVVVGEVANGELVPLAVLAVALAMAVGVAELAGVVFGAADVVVLLLLLEVVFAVVVKLAPDVDATAVAVGVGATVA